MAIQPISALARAAVAVWFLAPHLERAKTLIWLDAMGLGGYAVIGAGKAMALGVNPFVPIAMGVLTASFGGVIRDVLAVQPSALLEARDHHIGGTSGRGELRGARSRRRSAADGGHHRRDPGFGLRAGAIHYGWALPAFGAKREPRET